MANSKFSDSISEQTSASFSDSPELQEEWESFLANVSSRYGTPTAFDPFPDESKDRNSFKASPEPPEHGPKQKKSRRSVLPVLAGVICLLLVAGVAAIWVGSLLLDSKLPDGVTVSGISIGGLKRTQAAQVLKKTVVDPLEQTKMTVSVAGDSLSISPEESQISLDMDSLLSDAYAEENAKLSLLDYLRWNETALWQKIQTLSDNFSQHFIPSSYYLEGDIPQLDEEHFDPDVPCPTLVLNPGSSGQELDTQTLYSQILSAYASGIFSLEIPSQERTPEALDLEKILSQLSVTPIDASLDANTGSLIPGSYGLGVDTEAVQQLLDNALPGEEIRVSMEYQAPQILGQEVYFQDVLGFCQTPHSDNESRTKNLQLACASINGVVIQPGEVLSYNATLGRRTEENGYMPAPAYSGTELVDSIGGGICQVSSTLYLCSLYAEMEIVDRVSHGYPVSYIPIGTDATVSWGAPDLKIRNCWDSPVKIIAEERDGFVRIWLMGTDTRDYYVRVGFSSSQDGYARNYICKYDRQTNTLISRDSYQLSSYLGEIDAISGEIGSDQIYRFGMSREQEIGAPASETLEASRRCIAPNQFAED